MADTKISGLPASTTPLAGTEVLPIVQSGTTKQVSVANLTAGRAISASTVQATTTIGVGAATPSASGSGITFPATQSASTDVNTLDDYEEGTWTPTFTGWTTAPLVYYPTYTKIGRTVTINLYASGGVVAYSSIGGLPFTSSAMGASVIAVRVSGYDVAFYGTVGASSTTINSVNQINTLVAQNWALSFTYTTD